MDEAINEEEDSTMGTFPDSCKNDALMEAPIAVEVSRLRDKVCSLERQQCEINSRLIDVQGQPMAQEEKDTIPEPARSPLAGELRDLNTLLEGVIQQYADMLARLEL